MRLSTLVLGTAWISPRQLQLRTQSLPTEITKPSPEIQHEALTVCQTCWGTVLSVQCMSTEETSNFGLSCTRDTEAGASQYLALCLLFLRYGDAMVLDGEKIQQLTDSKFTSSCIYEISTIESLNNYSICCWLFQVLY
ncbi:hypothetical protein EV424DRAFT_273517 [Suillus variegatus]|nr:hypothetical protein EV424DRAFT_273517 [Suillus variegatus]